MTFVRPRYSVPLLMGDPTPAPASGAQLGMWLAHELSDSPGGFVVPLAFHIEGPVDVTALEFAIRETIVRHELLRSTFNFADDGLSLRIYPAVDFALDAQPLPEAVNTLPSIVGGALGEPWNLVGEPLIRVIFGRIRADDHLLVLLVSHTVFDSASAAILLADLEVAYAGETLSPVPGGAHAEFAQTLTALASQASHHEALEAWRATLEYAPPTSRPVCRPTIPGSREIAVVCRRLELPRQAALRLTAEEFGVTPTVVLLARLASAVMRATRSQDVVVGTPVSLRFDPEWELVVGMFADFVPLRARADDAGDLQAIAKQFRVQLDIAMRAPSVGFFDIVASANPPRLDGERPLFQVYATQEAPRATELRLAGCHCARIPVTGLQYPTDIGFEFTLGADVELSCTWNHTCHTDATIAMLIDHVATGRVP